MRLARAGFRASAAIIALVAGEAVAGEPAKPDFFPALDRAHALADAGKWSDAETALRRLFVDFEGDPRVRSHLREIEDDLTLSIFQALQKPVTGADLFGDAVVAFDPASREIELRYTDADGPRWLATYGSRFLEIRFDGTLTLGVSSGTGQPGNLPTGVLFCFDIERRGGYVLRTGSSEPTIFGTLVIPAGVAKLARGQVVALPNIAPAPKLNIDWSFGYRITRTFGEIAVSVANTCVVRARDSSFDSGYIGFAGGRPRNVHIKARVERTSYRKIVAEHRAAKFAEWLKTSWNRDEQIPAWAREKPVVVPDATLFEVPSDTLPESAHAVAAAALGASDGERDALALAAKLAADASPNTAAYLGAAASLGTGAYAEASAQFDALVAAEPKLAGARLLRGHARFRLRRIEDARADFEWLVKERPACGRAWAGLVMIEIYGNDLAAASALLEQATEQRVDPHDFGEIFDWVHRARRGPRLTQRFELVSEHFVVVSDHSQQVCYDASSLLERMQSEYATALGRAPKQEGKSRVFVFSGIDGYHDYAAGLEVAAYRSSGVYLPALRELALWMPIDMNDLKETIRHEGLHQYLHRLAESPPIWLDEGLAVVLEHGANDQVRNVDRDLESVVHFVPLRTLFAMGDAEFMANARPRYVQASYVVDYLRRTANPKLKNVLTDYVRAIASGLSQDEANRQVLEPVVELIESSYRRSPN